MNILFLTIGRITSIESHSIYADLLRSFRDHGHTVYAIAPNQKRTGLKTELIHENGAHILHVETGNVTGASNLVTKGIAQMSLEPTFIRAIKQYFADVKFDLVMYSTPPITFAKVVDFVKKRDGAKSYLLLKDIFPQNAVDLGMMTKTGPKGLIYSYFREKEKKLYGFSDFIGCMSEANVQYVLKNNPEVKPEKVEVCPNAVEVIDQSVDWETRIRIREKYGIPQDKTVYIYGGNLGKPQGIPFLITCLRKCVDIEDAYFLIVGKGNEYPKLEAFIRDEKPDNVKLVSYLPKEDYDCLVGACDVGLIFLDHGFTIPNFPSRLLSYMQAKLPVLAATDPNTDIGAVITNGGFGWWCESNDADAFAEKVRAMQEQDLATMKNNGYAYLNEHYSTENAYSIIMRHFTE